MRFFHHRSAGSTNALAQDLARSGDLGPLWVQADEQTLGRGRRGRLWVSVAGNLYASGLYPFDGEPGEAARLSFAAALSVRDAVKDYVDPTKLDLKWPNDVLIGGAKTCGILLEFGQVDGQGFVVVGIGINLLSHPDDTPYPATHVLAHMAGSDIRDPEPKVPTPQAVLAVLASRFTFWFEQYKSEGFGLIRNAWLEAAHGVPGRVKVNLASESFSGYAMTLGDQGELKVRLDDGSLRDVHAGDVFYEG